MIPVRTEDSNFVYRGPTRDIGDAWVERRPGDHVVYMEWQLEDHEKDWLKRQIDNGQFPIIRLGIFYVEPIPPVSLAINGDETRIVDAKEPPDHQTVVTTLAAQGKKYEARR